MFSLNKIPLKNLKAHPVRSLLLIFLIALQSLCIYFTFTQLTKMKKELSISQERFGADVIVYPYASLTKISKKKLLMQGTPICYYLSRAQVKRLSECEHIKELSYQVYIKDESGSQPIWIVGIESDSDFVIRPWVKKGSEIDLKENEVFAGSEVFTSNDNVTLFGKAFSVKAYLDSTGSELDSMVFVSMQTLKNLINLSKELGIETYKKVNPFKLFSSILIKTDGENYVDGVTHWINIHVRKVVAVRSEETLVASASGIQTSLRLTIIICISLWLILLSSLYIAQTMIMKERKKELYVWFTAGASSKKLRRVLLKEASLLLIAASITGFIIFIAFLIFTSSLSDYSFFYLGGLFLSAFLITMLTSLLSSYISIQLAIKKLSGQLLITI